MRVGDPARQVDDLVEPQLVNELDQLVMVAAASEDDKSGVAPRSHQGKGPDQIIEPLLRRKAADADDDRRSAIGEPGMLGRCLSQRCDRVGDDRIVDDADLRAVQANDMLQIVCDARRNGDDGIRGRVELPDQMGHHRRASVLPEGNGLGHRVMLTDDEANRGAGKISCRYRRDI